jgi:phosphate-selective porin
MMRNTIRTAAAVLVASAWVATATAVAAQQAPPFTLNVGARLQTWYVHSFPGAEGADPSGTFGIRRARLSVGGAAYEHFTYTMQLELAGASVVLLDANVRANLAPMATVWIGQGRVPFGRQILTSSGALNMVDRAITAGRFAPDRQIGVALMGQNEARTFEYGAGVYNGEGPRTPNLNDRFMYVARAVVTPLGAYGPAESAFDYPASPRVALGAAVAHNTVGSGDAERDVLRLGLEGAFKLRGLNVTGEYFREQVSGEWGADGGYAQAGYLLPDRRHELVGRWAVIRPDPLWDPRDQVELGIGHSYYLNAHRAKIQTDLRRLTDRVGDVSDVQLRIQLQVAM